MPLHCRLPAVVAVKLRRYSGPLRKSATMGSCLGHLGLKATLSMCEMPPAHQARTGMEEAG